MLVLRSRYQDRLPSLARPGHPRVGEARAGCWVLPRL